MLPPLSWSVHDSGESWSPMASMDFSSASGNKQALAILGLTCSGFMMWFNKNSSLGCVFKEGRIPDILHQIIVALIMGKLAQW